MPRKSDRDAQYHGHNHRPCVNTQLLRVQSFAPPKWFPGYCSQLPLTRQDPPQPSNSQCAIVGQPGHVFAHPDQHHPHQCLDCLTACLACIGTDGCNEPQRCLMCVPAIRETCPVSCPMYRVVINHSSTPHDTLCTLSSAHRRLFPIRETHPRSRRMRLTTPALPSARRDRNDALPSAGGSTRVPLFARMYRVNRGRMHADQYLDHLLRAHPPLLGCASQHSDKCLVGDLDCQAVTMSGI